MRRSLCRPRRSRDCMRTTSSWRPRSTAYTLGLRECEWLRVVRSLRALRASPRRVSERVAVALWRDAKLLLPHVARVGAAAGEQYRDLAMPRFEFQLGENRRNLRDQREESPLAVGQHSEQVE